ncbi:nucleotidyl transferase AbiEii/AbiGii toxin family protein [Aureibaculum sp. 2210JD6-5]|uniref:nucleotidyl transferase AbiEii/AbiGii toxin family protein n=1 Tax=Aureibaculum sp. 2210JD6-5 TaxID=3103957 RepID=UPI002AAD821D|nr:nucleotidyl transferase AbiEii/AbiGii toxin family protein [Aureibaculum sp. 2210JD6-5]MDY7394552.1 nucleotidyl transferase AbiEii/AbiGii toxin family protein [Aureibaculum sp. 2210JD6-5]
MEEWFKLSENDRRIVINQVSTKTGLLPVAVEKDLWVMIALQAVFSTEVAEHIVFKGGTSLSKAWGIIERFSEDIDLAIDRAFFGFNGELSRAQVKNLRKTSCKYIDEKFHLLLKEALLKNGVKEFELSVTEFEESDTDPLAIELRYNSIVEQKEYLQPRILIEISSRSLIEPYENKKLSSLISESYPKENFIDQPINVPTVIPTRTLIEKMFLLHEEFQKPKDRKIRSERMTRHLYDISRLMETEYLEKAITNKELYDTIIEHRNKLTKVSWVDYDNHRYSTLNFIPPKEIIDYYKKDYEAMTESMFYGETDSFENLIKKLKKLNDRINGLE